MGRPVKLEIRLRMSQDIMIPANPKMAMVKLEEAWAVFLGSPLEKRNWKPPAIRTKKNIRPTKKTIV